MANVKLTTEEKKVLYEQFNKIEQSIADLIKTDEKLKDEVERMKVLINYVPGSSLKK